MQATTENPMNGGSVTTNVAVDLEADLPKKTKEEALKDATQDDWRFGENKDGTLRDKIKYVKERYERGEEVDGDPYLPPKEEGKGPRRKFDILGKYKKMLGMIQASEEEEKLKNDIIAFKYATDMSYRRDSTPEEVWTAVKRREAWAQDPIRMSIVLLSQVLLCAIALVTTNSAVNSATVVMAVVYISTQMVGSSFHVCHDLLKYCQGLYKKIHKGKGVDATLVVIGIACFFLSPLIAFVFLIALILDLIVGEIKDMSYGELANTVVDFIVIFTGFSVGIRSGNAINAIQTFAGFSFISEMDEALMETFTVDLDAKTSTFHGKGKARKILVTRLATYAICPLLLIFFAYVTIANVCWVFCNDSGR